MYMLPVVDVPGFLVSSISNKFSNIEVRARSIAVVYKLPPFSSYSRNGFNLLKTKIRNFSEEVSSLYYILEGISKEYFKNCAPLFAAHRAVETLSKPCLLSFSFAEKHCDTAQKFCAFFVQ